MGKYFKIFISSLVNAFPLLAKNDPLVLASSTAFFATFSLSPIVIILVNLFSFYLKNEVVKKELFEKIQNTFGKESAEQIATIVENVSSIERNLLFTVLGFVFLLFVATTLLHVIKHAINSLWKVRKKEVSRLRYTFRERITAVGIIIVTGLLFNFSPEFVAGTPNFILDIKQFQKTSLFFVGQM